MRTKLLAWLLIFFFVAALGFLAYFFSPREIAESDLVPEIDQNGTRIPPPQPGARPEDYVGAQPSRGFQVVVSYVGGGFEPAAVQIRQGDTVRFTNNSRGLMWIAASERAGVVYPSVQNGCGSSALDSCAALEPGQYWEFTFENAGTWSFQNILNKAKGGVVTVVP